MIEKNSITSRKIKAQETKQKIYTTAKQLYETYPFDDITVEDIVKQAGVAKGTFYIYFKSKDDLVASFIFDYVGKVDTDYKTYLDSFDTNTTASEVLLGLVTKIVEELQEVIGYDSMKLLYKMQLEHSLSTDSVISYNRSLYKLFEQIINKGIASKEFTDKIDAMSIAKNILISFRGLTYEWCVRYPSFDIKKEALLHFNLMLNGIKV